MTKFSKGFLGGLAAVAIGLSATAVSAGQDNASKAGLKGWLEGANQAVDEVMIYPLHAERRGYSGASTFRVTIDRSGEVINSELTQSRGRHILKSAAREVLLDVDFPELPAAYSGRSLTFSLQLSYLRPGSALESYNLKRQTDVSVDQVGSDRLSAGRITILSDNSAD